jgi:hypothetical protein
VRVFRYVLVRISAYHCPTNLRQCPYTVLCLTKRAKYTAVIIWYDIADRRSGIVALCNSSQWPLQSSKVPLRLLLHSRLDHSFTMAAHQRLCFLLVCLLAALGSTPADASHFTTLKGKLTALLPASLVQPLVPTAASESCSADALPSTCLL